MKEEALKNFERDDYQLDNFQDFIDHNGFSFKEKAIHIAGTNGKGSTAWYLYHIYRQAGLKVGIFTSPYEKEINEMIVVNGKTISDQDLQSYLKKYEKDFKKYALSPFEIETFIALNYFHDQKVDLAIIECGMGGEEDATNIITPILSIITSVSLDHTEYLGRTTSEIALKKAGIIKFEIPVIVGEVSEIDMDVISDVCHKKKSKLIPARKYSFEKIEDDGYTFTCSPYQNLHISTPSLYSMEDACLVVEAIKTLQDTFPVSEEQLRRGLKEMSLSLRMEIVHYHPLVILDGSHNVEGMNKTCLSLEKYADGTPIHVIFACFKDKNAEGMLTNLNFISQDINLTTFNHPRAREENDFFLYCDDYPFSSDYQALMREKMEMYPNDIILICGSLAFVALVKDMFK